MSSGGYHFVGVGGIGMSAIARVLLARGETVSGSDAKPSPLLDALRSEGVRTSVGHAAEHVNGARTVVVSSAIDRHNPEFVAARKLGVRVLLRGEMLAELLAGRRGIAVCGTHGKTTTTAMIYAVLRGGGIDAGLVLGGIDGVLGTNASDGSAPWFVTEADESDGSFALLDPTIAVVTNVENDHLTSDDELPQLVGAFEEFLAKIPAADEGGRAIVGIDNAHSASLASGTRAAALHTFGFDPNADTRAVNLRSGQLGSTFDAVCGGVCLGSVDLALPGAMNVENALAAIAVGRELDVPFVRIAQALRAFRPVRRRFDILARTARMVVVDDYAHHPTAIEATLAAARGAHPGPLIVVFQPHRYTRTAFLAREFASALHGADRVYLTPVYAAAEPAIPGVSERSIGEPLSEMGTPVRYLPVAHAAAQLFEDAPEGAMVLFLGAGDITDAAAQLARLVAGPAAVGA